MALAICKTDGGRQSSGYTYEKKDCTVRSFALAADVPYATAHDVAKRSGRQNCKGWWAEKILAEARKDGLVEFVEMPVGAQNVGRYHFGYGFITKIQYPTIETVVRRYRKGRYVMSTRNHAFAVIDGVIHDTGARPRARVLSIFEVRPIETPKPAVTQDQINSLWERLNKLEAK